MCRLLLVRFHQLTSPSTILGKFARMSERSKSLDGDWQGDGWGVAWLDQQNNWQVKKSLSPIWEETALLEQVPASSILVAHARSASFPHHKGVIEFNQPYISDRYAFVFNGLLKGVSLSDVPGRIGAEKIWSLLQRELEENEPQQALINIQQLLLNNSKEIIALNMGLATKENIYSLNYFSKSPEYYTLHHWNEPTAEIICSEAL